MAASPVLRSRRIGFRRKVVCSHTACAHARFGEFHDHSGDSADEERERVLEYAPRDALVQIFSIVNFGSLTPSPVRCSPVKVEGDQASGTIYVLRSGCIE
jgi:hypothetical protein